MIRSLDELKTTMERLGRFQQQVIVLRTLVDSPENYRASAAGYLAEIDRMILEMRDYLWIRPATPMSKLLL